MPLCKLLEHTPLLATAGDLDVGITDVVSDSRQVTPGALFVCTPGYVAEGGETRADRHDFIDDAVRRGAAAVVVEREVPRPAGVTLVRVPDGWQAVSDLAAQFYGQPSSDLTVLGITGTNGKTSTTYLVDAVCRAAGRRTALLGTIEYRLGEGTRPPLTTTPEAPYLHKILREAVDRGLDTVVMEVSSHALALKRVAGVRYDVALFTNLTQDHLNFHPDMAHYRAAKGRLFEGLGAGGKRGVGIVNADDPESDFFRARCPGEVLTFGLEKPADVRASEVHFDLNGTHFHVTTPVGEMDLRLRLLGDYNVLNALGACAVGIALGFDLETIREGLATTVVPGRFELVDEGQDFVVAVDYAHTPDALANVLRMARKLQPHRLICVFGCGGDRDRTKRPRMARVVAELSDVMIVTSDNPRTEDPDAIIDEIMPGIPPDAPVERHRLTDRTEAIRAAVRMAQPNDLLVIAGKGHENYQVFGHRRIHFDDREVAAAALREGR